MSLNVRGFGGAPKMLALKELFLSVKPDIIFLQETLVDQIKENNSFLKIYPSWTFAALDAVGNSGGVLSGWNPKIGRLEAFTMGYGILLEGLISGIPQSVSMLNVYGPYRDRVQFWSGAEEAGVLRLDSLILGGDLNFTLNSREVCGERLPWIRRLTFFGVCLRMRDLLK